MTKTLKMTLLYAAVLASALMIIALVVTSVVHNALADTPAVMTLTQSDNEFWLRSYNGHIAVYDNNVSDTPIIETVIAVEGLRTVDKAMLEDGIKANSYEDVLKLLEDFGS